MYNFVFFYILILVVVRFIDDLLYFCVDLLYVIIRLLLFLYIVNDFQGCIILRCRCQQSTPHLIKLCYETSWYKVYSFRENKSFYLVKFKIWSNLWKELTGVYSLKCFWIYWKVEVVKFTLPFLNVQIGRSRGSTENIFCSIASRI